ncbi:hypothetical protein HUJ05_000263 [Dendroctonus ponderosae]|nr:hypothetical protein HUJ05_000263 [Dendroctonus ponderosae]
MRSFYCSFCTSFVQVRLLGFCLLAKVVQQFLRCNLLLDVPVGVVLHKDRLFREIFGMERSNRAGKRFLYSSGVYCCTEQSVACQYRPSTYFLHVSMSQPVTVNRSSADHLLRSARSIRLGVGPNIVVAGNHNLERSVCIRLRNRKKSKTSFLIVGFEGFKVIAGTEYLKKCEKHRELYACSCMVKALQRLAPYPPLDDATDLNFPLYFCSMV